MSAFDPIAVLETLDRPVEPSSEFSAALWQRLEQQINQPEPAAIPHRSWLRRHSLQLPRKWSRLQVVVVIALIFLLLGCAATATYLLLRGNSGLAFPGVNGQLLIVGPDGSRRHTGRVCSKWRPGDITGCGIGQPAWSPDGTRVAFVAGRRGLGGLGFGRSDHEANSVDVVAADGTGFRKLARCGLCGELSDSDLGWSPNGRWIVFSRSGHHRESFWESLWIVASTGGKPHRLTHCNRCVDARPAWSPNGHLLLFQRAPAGAPRADSLYTVRPNGSHLTRIRSDAADPAWSPDGRQIAYDEVTFPRRKDGVRFWGQGGVGVVDANGSHPRLLTPERWERGQRLLGPGRWARGQSLSYPAWSPDGRKLLFLQTPQRAGRHTGHREEIWTMSPDGSNKKRLYRSVRSESTYAPPSWSPDGQIAFAVIGKPTFARIGNSGKAKFAGIEEMFRRLRDEARRNRSQVQVKTNFGSFEIKPDGTVLREVKDPTGIFVMNADGTGLKRVSPVPWPQLAWQPPPKGKHG